MVNRASSSRMEDLLTEGGATEQETKLFMKQLAEVRVQLAPKRRDC